MKGLIFDMDGTLLDTERIAMEAIDKAAAQYGVALDLEAKHSLMGISGPAKRARFLELFGPAFDFEGYQRTEHGFQDQVLRRQGVPVKPGAQRLLTLARRAGLRCAVATATQRTRAEERLRRAGLLDAFQAVVCGEDVSRPKPNPDIFLLAAKRLGLEVQDCAGIEDSRNGILAVRRAGMFSVLVPDLIPPDGEMRQAADLLCPSLNHLADYLF